MFSHLLSRGIVLSTLLFSSISVSAAVPSAPPPGGVPGGIFSSYFTNMQLPCGGTSYVVSGFGPQLIPLCTDITSIIGTYMGTNIDALIRNYLKVNVTNSLIGQVLSGFDSITGNPVFTAMNSSQWIDGLFGSISYPSGNVGIGTIGIPSERLEVVGNVAVSGNVTASGTITASGHLTTKAYVDAAIVSAVGGGDEMANCIPASQALMNARGIPKTLCYKSSTEFACFYASSRQKSNSSGYISEQAIYIDNVSLPNTYHPYFWRTIIFCSDNRLATAPKNYECRQSTQYGAGGPANENQVLNLASYCMIY